MYDQDDNHDGRPSKREWINHLQEESEEGLTMDEIADLRERKAFEESEYEMMMDSYCM